MSSYFRDPTEHHNVARSAFALSDSESCLSVINVRCLRDGDGASAIRTIKVISHLRDKRRDRTRYTIACHCRSQHIEPMCGHSRDARNRRFSTRGVTTITESGVCMTTSQPDIKSNRNPKPTLVAWNSPPLDIRSAPTLSTFKNMLKTHLFSRSYFTD